MSSFTFAHVADMHWGSGEGTAQCANDAVTAMVDSLNAQAEHPLPDFVVFSGDNVDGGVPGPYDQGTTCERQTQALKRVLDRLAVPYHVIAHNHDVWGEDPVGMRIILGGASGFPAGYQAGPTVLGSALRRHFGAASLRQVRQLPGHFTGVFMSECYVEDGAFRTLETEMGWLVEALLGARGGPVLLFAHVPLLWPRHPETDDVFPSGSEVWNFSGAHSRLCALLTGAAERVVQYAGHLHVHGYNQSGRLHVVTTAGLCTYPGEYRLVTVHPDRIEHRCVRVPGVAERPMCWGSLVDEEHPTPEAFHGGVPRERDFAIPFSPVG
ncbi:MAG: metallophosphoesterase [Candidatus Latescibacterota bacterium]